ncbi:PREDICTED: superoxide dismutase [Mn] 3-like [Priapulus caudatus]|uniref:Superoxide dismutase [Mn] 3-like n=1 Tax=Priapulus caudatus TaxID=37621 RepID=A0ABM1EY18_PRICU|nr:PREDICTED: superoxide dismutase [Mn] 3-like [Priapulus caudatus]
MNTFGNFSIFKNIFTDVSSSYFGSGYVWLCRDFNIGHGSHLMIATTANQDSPLSEGLHPILGIDLWEHAYYLKHQNARAAYIDDWWRVVSWDAVAQLDKWWSKRNMHDEL